MGSPPLSLDKASRPPLLLKLAGIDLRSLAAMRMGLAALVIVDGWTALLNAHAFYSDDGFLPRSLWPTMRDSMVNWSLHGLSGSTSWQVLLILLQIAAGVALLLGWRTTLATVLSWVLVCSLQNRNPVVLFGGDVVVRMLLFWSIFLPLGKRWSLDVRRKGGETLTANPFLSTTTLALLLQVCIIYWFTARLKWGVEWTRDGTAVYYALSIDQFVKPLGLWLRNFPELGHWLTFVIWWVECIGPFAAFIPWRTERWRLATVATFWALHIGLGLCLRLGPFPAIMMVCWLPFLPGSFWDWLQRRSPADGPATTPSRSWREHALTQSFVLLCLLVVVVWNLRSVDYDKWKRWFPTAWNPPVQALKLDQYWALFAPHPLSDDGWLVLDAELVDGSHVDLLRDGKPVSFLKPAGISAEFPDYRWHKLLMNLWAAKYQTMRHPVCGLLERQWKEKAAPNRQVKAWTLSFMEEKTLPAYHALIPQKVELARKP
jgi:hypothetical protein